MSDKREIVTNKDNELLRPWGNEKIVIGYVEEVNGAGAMEVPEFDPTRHELIQLVKYWAEVAFRIEYEWFLTGCTGSTEMRLKPFAWNRIGRIAEHLGDEEVKKVLHEVYDEFEKKQDKRLWDIWLNGTKEQWDAVRDKFHGLPEKSLKGKPK